MLDAAPGCHVKVVAMSQGETTVHRPEMPAETGRARRAVPWTVKDVSLGVLALVVLFMLVLGLSAFWGVFLRVKGEPESTLLALSATMVLEVLMLVVAWRLTVRKYRVPWRMLGFSSLRNKDLLATWVVLGAGLVVAIVYGALVSLLAVDRLKPPPLPPVFAMTGWPWVFGLVLVLVAAPIAEETFFRGFLFAGIARRYGFWWGAGLSAILFSAAHVELGALIPIFALGLLLAWLYSRTGSLWSCILAHFLYNGLILAIAV